MVRFDGSVGVVDLGTLVLEVDPDLEAAAPELLPAAAFLVVFAAALFALDAFFAVDFLAAAFLVLAPADLEPRPEVDLETLAFFAAVAVLFFTVLFAALFAAFLTTFFVVLLAGDFLVVFLVVLLAAVFFAAFVAVLPAAAFLAVLPAGAFLARVADDFLAVFFELLAADFFAAFLAAVRFVATLGSPSL